MVIRRVLLTAIALLLAVMSLVPSSRAYAAAGCSDRICGGEAGVNSNASQTAFTYVYDGSGFRPVVNGADNYTTSAAGPAYVYDNLLACGTNAPGAPNGEASCAGAICTVPGQAKPGINYFVFRQAPGQAGWDYRGTSCQVDGPVISTAQVDAAVHARLEQLVPPISAQLRPDGQAITQIPEIVWVEQAAFPAGVTQAADGSITFPFAGPIPVTVTARPTWTWSWGDGSADTTTTTPGRAYDGGATPTESDDAGYTVHTYRQRGAVTLTCTQRWTATWDATVAGAPAGQPVAQPVQRTTAQALPILEARAHLTG